MKLTLLDKHEEAKDTYSFFWKSTKKLGWAPGQYIYYTLPKLLYPDDRGPTRQFTISSSPTEGLVRLTTRIRDKSGYKQTLNKLNIGDKVDAEGPTGSYVLDDKLKSPQVLLAGGIGITPFRSFIKYNIDNNLKIPTYVIYSNSNKDFVFKSELDQWQIKHDFIKIHYHNSGNSGHLNKLVIKKLFRNLKLEIRNSNFWLVGPPLFVSAIEGVLGEIGIPDEQVHSEKFTGY